jgi:hypothetical protein
MLQCTQNIVDKQKIRTFHCSKFRQHPADYEITHTQPVQACYVFVSVVLLGVKGKEKRSFGKRKRPAIRQQMVDHTIGQNGLF